MFQKVGGICKPYSPKYLGKHFRSCTDTPIPHYNLYDLILVKKKNVVVTERNDPLGIIYANGNNIVKK